MNRTEILVIDDEEQIRRTLVIMLQHQQYQVRQATSGHEGLIMAGNHPPDLILLDLGLPDMNGLEVLQQLRGWFTNPVIILSVLNEEDIIIHALDSGANDYLTKPFRSGELLARIRSALRSSLPEDVNSTVVAGDLVIDLDERTVKKQDELVKLTGTEYALISLFAKNEGKVLTHQFLLRTVWGPGYINQSQYLRVYIAQLRKKIEDDPNRPVHLLTESGVGYRFVAGAGPDQLSR